MYVIHANFPWFLCRSSLGGGRHGAPHGSSWIVPFLWPNSTIVLSLVGTPASVTEPLRMTRGR